MLNSNNSPHLASANNFPDDDKLVIEHIIHDIVIRANQELKNVRQDAARPQTPAATADATNVVEKTTLTGDQNDDHTGHSPSVTTSVPPPTSHKSASTPLKENLATLTPYLVTETLAAFVLRSVAMDPLNSFDVNYEFTSKEVERLVQTCVNRIVTPNDPQMETVKMQVYFDTHFPAQVDFLHKEKLAKVQSVASVLKEITDVKTKNISVYETLYRKIVSYILLKSEVGNPTDMRTVRETTAALESVFPQTELTTFIPTTRVEKEEKLNGLTQLVTGIRLFNKQLGKGGETIDNLPELCASELQDLTIVVGQMTTVTEEAIQIYLGVLDYTEKFPHNEVIPEGFNIQRLKSALVFKRQMLMYSDALQDQFLKSRTTLLTLSTKFDAAIRELKVTCRAKTAVAVDQVYPQFILLANLWGKWLDELFLLAFRRGIVDMLNHHARAFHLEISEQLYEEARPLFKDIEPENLTESEILKKASDLMTTIANINRGVDVIHPGNTVQYFQLSVEYGGFCPVTLALRDGVVIPGNKNIGLLRYKDFVFSFVNSEAAKEFARHPDKYMNEVVELAKGQPQLVQLMHLYQYFPTVEALERARSFNRQRLLRKLPMVSEASCQVDTHIVDGYIDSKYEWNEWELRRQALMLVNLKSKATHGSQTELSHFRRDSETQHYVAKAKITQTRKDSNSNVPRRVNYIRGIRNDGVKNCFRVVDLTLQLAGQTLKEKST